MISRRRTSPPPADGGGLPEALTSAFRCLARRALSECEIRERLSVRGFDRPTIDSTVDRLRDLSMIDDAALASRLAASMREGRLYGPRRIEAMLRKRGLPPPLVAVAIREGGAVEDEVRCAVEAVRRKFRDGIPPGREGYAKAFRFLAGRGFSGDACRRAMGRRFDDETTEGER